MDAQARIGPILGTLCVSAMAAVVACLGDAAGVSTAWALVAGVVGAAAAYWWCRHEDQEARRARRLPRRAHAEWFWASVCLAAAAWVAYVYRNGLYSRSGDVVDWHQNTWAALVAGTAVLCVVAYTFAWPAQPEPVPGAGPYQPAVAGPPPRDPAFAEWEARFAGPGESKNTSVLSIKWWPVQPGHSEPYGYTVAGRLPAGGATIDRLEARQEEMASDLDLADGCGIEVLPAGSRRNFVVEVAIRDALAEPRDFPDDLSPTSINMPTPYGFYRNGEITAGDLRSATAVVIGQKRSGKTNTVKGIMCNLARTVDTIIMVIDIPKRGALARPFVDPWVEGAASRPLVDWIAPDADEALAMTDFALEVIGQRSIDYQNLMAEHDDDKIPVSAQVPALVLLIDESAEVMGQDVRDDTLKQIGANIEEIIRTGGGLAVNMVVCALRATLDTLPTGIKKQANLRIGMRVTDDDEVRHLFGWNGRLSIADAPHQGCGFERENQDTVRPFRSWLMKPSTIRRVAVACAERRPDMDAVSLRVPSAGEWVSRWERVLPMLYGPEVAREVLGRGPYERRPGGGQRGGHLVPLSTYEEDDLSTPQPVRVAPPVHPRDEVDRMPAEGGRVSARAGQRGFTVAADVALMDRELDRVAHLLEEERALEHAALARPEPALDGDEVEVKRVARERVMELLLSAGPRGATVAQLRDALSREGLETPEKTIYNWLRNSAVNLEYRYWGHPQHHPLRSVGGGGSR